MISATSSDDLVDLLARAVRVLRDGRDWKANVDTLFAEIGTRLRLGRVYLFQMHELPDGTLGQTCHFDWAAPGLKVLNVDPRNVDEAVAGDDLFESWCERRRRGETIQGLTRDLTGYLREDYEHQAIKSFLSAPVMVNSQWWGHIGFDDCEHERRWTPGEIAVLESVAALLGSAVELSGSSLVSSEASRIALLHAALDAIIVLDEAECILEFNPAAEALTGRVREEVLGTSFRRAVVFADGDRTALLLGAVARAQGRTAESRVVKPDGRDVPVEVVATGVRLAGRSLTLVNIRDITERRAAEAEVVRQRNALHQSEKMSALGSLLAGIAHELNNPLSVVVGRAILLEEDSHDPDQRHQLGRLREAAERCARISQNFLKMARQSPLARRRVDLNETVQAALDIVAYAARSSGVSVALDLSPDAPEVLADADQIVQVLVNLMINAIQAMGSSDGERRLRVVTRADAAAGTVTARVEDNGPGIPEAIMPRIFEPFFTTKAVGVGTGVGLAVSQGMAASHGGTLSAANRAGGGAVFTLALPLPADREFPDRLQVSAAEPTVPRRRDILVVDDEPDVAALLQDILERSGARVDLADNGAAALELASAGRYDAIFCDVKMPQLDGRTFRRRLAEAGPPPAFVFVTGDLLGVGGAAELDGCPVIGKPFRPAQIIEALEAVRLATPMAD